MRTVNVYITCLETGLIGNLKNILKNMRIISPNMLITLKKTWDGIKKIVNLEKTSKRTTQLNIEGKIIGNDNDIARNFNNFFVNVRSSTEKSIPKVSSILPSKFLKDRIWCDPLPLSKNLNWLNDYGQI